MTQAVQKRYSAIKVRALQMLRDGHSQSSIAVQLGVPASTISQWKRSSRIEKPRAAQEIPEGLKMLQGWPPRDLTQT